MWLRTSSFVCFFTCCLVHFLGAQETSATTYQDTLEVEIGEQAKVVFLAKSAKDFQYIDRYDLNFLFDELWEQRQSGNLDARELSRAEAESFREGQSTENGTVRLSKHRHFINLFLGWSQGFSANYVLNGPSAELVDPEAEITATSLILVPTDSRLCFGIDIGRIAPLLSRPKGELLLRYGVGFELNRVHNRPQVTNGITPTFPNGITPDQAESFNEQVWDSGLADSLIALNSTTSIARQFATQFLFVELIPSWQFMNREGKNTWHFGLGLRAGIDLKDLGKPGPSLDNILTTGTTDPIYRVRRSWQYAIVAQFGSELIQFQVSCLPNAYDLVQQKQRNFPDGPTSSSRSRALLSAGVRFGL